MLVKDKVRPVGDQNGQRTANIRHDVLDTFQCLQPEPQQCSTVYPLMMMRTRPRYVRQTAILTLQSVSLSKPNILTTTSPQTNPIPISPHRYVSFPAFCRCLHSMEIEKLPAPDRLLLIELHRPNESEGLRHFLSHPTTFPTPHH